MGQLRLWIVLTAFLLMNCQRECPSCPTCATCPACPDGGVIVQTADVTEPGPDPATTATVLSIAPTLPDQPGLFSELAQSQVAAIPLQAQSHIGETSAAQPPPLCSECHGQCDRTKQAVDGWCDGGCNRCANDGQRDACMRDCDSRSGNIGACHGDCDTACDRAQGNSGLAGVVCRDGWKEGCHNGCSGRENARIGCHNACNGVYNSGALCRGAWCGNGGNARNNCHTQADRARNVCYHACDSNCRSNPRDRASVNWLRIRIELTHEEVQLVQQAGAAAIGLPEPIATALRAASTLIVAVDRVGGNRGVIIIAPTITPLITTVLPRRG
jgi:hypothetical protein